MVIQQFLADSGWWDRTIFGWRRRTALLFLVLLTFVCYGQPEAGGQLLKRIDGSAISSDSLSRCLERLTSEARVAGLYVCVFNDNKPVYAKTLGYANLPKGELLTPSTVLYGASLSKAVFSYIVLQLVQEKVIELDKPLVDYLPKSLMDYTFEGKIKDFKDLADDPRYKKITARMCLDHTTGFPNFRWFEPDRKIRIKFEPGSRVSYSGEGMILLQLVLREITGKDYETMARERVFIPFGMERTSYIWQPRFEEHLALGHDSAGRTPFGFPRRTYASSAGSMITTAEDYTKFYTALIQSRGLSKTSFREMTKPQIRIRSVKQFGPWSWKDSTLNEDIQLSYGLGFGIIQTPFGEGYFKEGHDDGWAHYTIAFPRKKIAIIILTNSDNGEGIFRELLATAIGDRFSPWFWENYIPYNEKTR